MWFFKVSQMTQTGNNERVSIVGPKTYVGSLRTFDTDCELSAFQWTLSHDRLTGCLLTLLSSSRQAPDRLLLCRRVTTCRHPACR